MDGAVLKHKVNLILFSRFAKSLCYGHRAYYDTAEYTRGAWTKQRQKINVYTASREVSFTLPQV